VKPSAEIRTRRASTAAGQCAGERDHDDFGDQVRVAPSDLVELADNRLDLGSELVTSGCPLAHDMRRHGENAEPVAAWGRAGAR